MSDFNLNVIEWSTRYDRSDKAFRDYLHELLDDRIDFALLTEARNRKALLKDMGLDFIGGVEAECIVIWRDKRGRSLIAVETPATTDKALARGGNPHAPVNRCTTAVFDHDSGPRTLVTIDHTPSKVDGRKGFGGVTERVRTYISIQRGWKRHIKEMIKKYDVDVVIIAADWNLDWKKRWVRTYMKHWNSIGARPVWTKKRLRHVERGTHGPRVIDGFLVATRGKWAVKIKRASVLPRSPLAIAASDHLATMLQLVTMKLRGK